ncbi:hypothetical protein VCHC81A2_1290, partial [Vibrio cholerae HC-81A2]
MKLQPLWLG